MSDLDGFQPYGWHDDAVGNRQVPIYQVNPMLNPKDFGLGSAIGLYILSMAAKKAEEKAKAQGQANSNASTTQCVGDCGQDSECTQRKRDVARALANVQKRYHEMEVDPFGMKQGAAPTGKGDWAGHVKAYREAQNRLRKALKKLTSSRCTPNPESEEWVRKSPPESK
ncbi:hypothetical protein LQ948_18230 [Jiella sp. MQZ9-1]|uniref:Uncharacterized protein n=1 Tax=Jiella flava TaxID=2816857 RepID=A0A939JYK6_9HYPH|nr:hypothetical protein [Jiella flava]MBO0664506.1 hypothetical protein [Jiella flava]MCD2473142.1 hypothetical protein [Jiella flava]